MQVYEAREFAKQGVNPSEVAMISKEPVRTRICFSLASHVTYASTRYL